MHTTLDTCGKPFTYEEPFFSRFQELMKYTDLLLFDIKHIDNEEHKKLTHWDNENILEMAQYLSKINKPVWIRHVLVPERSDYDEYLIRLDNFIQNLVKCRQSRDSSLSYDGKIQVGNTWFEISIRRDRTTYKRTCRKC